MIRVVATGIQDFEQLRIKNAFYVDKTDFIREWWHHEDVVTLIARPRRCGKTLNMSMMNCFFSGRYANRGELFEGLKIWEDADMRGQQGKWPVIFLSFAGIKGATYADTMEQMKAKMVELFASYPELYAYDGFQKNEIEALQSIRETMSDTKAALAIHLLCMLLEKIYDKKVLIFLDEYDTPLQEAYLNGYWDQMVQFIRIMYGNAFKSNSALARGIMTGITYVSKESVFSDLNNLEVVTTTSTKYATAFGFTEDEVFDALDHQGLGRQKETAKAWYDGFTFGGITDIYNPWSITNYLDKGVLKPYWANSSGNGMVSRLIQQGDRKIKTQFETMMDGGTIEVILDEEIIYNQLDTKPDAIWSLLLATGYLSVAQAPGSQEPEATGKPVYRLRLTNLEVQMMFQSMIEDWFAFGGGVKDFARAMFAGNTEEMEDYLNSIMRETMSFFDTGRKSGNKTPENFYHGFVLGLLVETKGDYLLRSNRESGYGRYDLILEPRDIRKPAVILEFKVFNPRRGEKTLEDTAREGLMQIEEQKYDSDLLARGIAKERILKYGLGFKGKECLILKA
ncbi:MAG: AAA family ATPase [Clostridia bacterium]|nr:AAA family ATPase [Clostridia bacterium]